MAKLSSPRTELAVLRAACHRNELISGNIIRQLDDSYFYAEESQEAFQLIREIRNETGRPVSYRMLLENPNITADTVSFLRNSEAVIQDPKQATKAINALAEFRRRRALAEMTNTLGDALSKPRVNSKELLHKAAQQLSAAQTAKDDDSYTFFGTRDNANDIVHEILYKDRSNSIVPTGFKTFDSVNGGLFEGSLFAIAGTTGGGKSTLANQLGVNIASAGYKVDILPLEMSKLEMTIRMMANVTNFDALDLLLGKVTSKEKKMIEAKFQKWRNYVKRKGGGYNIYKPGEDVTMEDALNAMSVYGSKVKIIDYMGLLSGMDGDDQWRKLGNAARYGKIYAENTGSIVIILAQLDDMGKVRYSRAIAEHSSNLWTFVSSNESREAGLININQDKARNQRMFPFSLKVNPATMRVRDLPNNGVDYANNLPSPDKQLPNLADSL